MTICLHTVPFDLPPKDLVKDHAENFVRPRNQRSQQQQQTSDLDVFANQLRAFFGDAL